MITRQQKLFCEYYVQTNSHKEAALMAGYSKGTAEKGGILRNPVVKNYLREMIQDQDSDKVMKTDEILQTLTRIARGEEYEEVIIPVNTGGGTQEVQKWNKKAIPKDRLKAIELLGKYLGLWDKMKEELSKGEHTVKITFEEAKQIESKS